MEYLLFSKIYLLHVDNRFSCTDINSLNHEKKVHSAEAPLISNRKRTTATDHPNHQLLMIGYMKLQYSQKS